MATVSEIEPGDEESEEETETWLNKWRVPAVPVLVGMLLLTLGMAYGFAQIVWTRDDAADALRAATCEQQQEFRGFFTSYLASQIGTPVDEIPGFDQLSPEARQLAISLAPVVEAGRERDQAALTEYMLQFPIPTCPPPDT